MTFGAIHEALLNILIYLKAKDNLTGSETSINVDYSDDSF